MNRFYVRAAAFSLSLSVLLPLSAVVPNGSEVLSMINGAPIATTNALQEKMKEVVERTRPEGRTEAFAKLAKANFATTLLNFMTTAKLAQLYTQDNKLTSTTFSRSIINGLEILINKHAYLTLKSEEKESLHHCIIMATSLFEGLRENKIIAEAADKVPARVVETAYQQVLQQAARYNINEVPTYKEAQPYLKLALAAVSSPELLQQLQLQGIIILMRLNEKYNVKYNTEAVERFLREHCQGTVV